MSTDPPVGSSGRVSRRAGGGPLRAQDAFFVHDTTPAVARQLGAVLMLEEAAAVIPLERLADHISGVISERASTLPMLARRLEAPPGRWPRWQPVEELHGAEHLVVRTIGASSAPNAGWQGAVEEFFGTPLRTDRPPWLLQLVRDAGTGRTAVLAKMHHALGDGLAMTETLVRLLSDAEPARGATPTRRPPHPARIGLRRRATRAGTVLRGLRSLAMVGLAPATGLDGAKTSQRRYAALELPAAEVRAVAREYAVSSSAVLLAVVAEALHRLRDDGSGPTPGRELRAMVPRSTRAARVGAEGGNWTAAVSLDLPAGPMPPAQRLIEVAARLAALDRGGQPAAIAAVLATLGRLPAAVQARLVGLISGRRFFDLIVSVLPGSRRTHRMAGAQVSAVFPMLPLGRVGLAIGLISWSNVVGVGITVDAALLADPDELADRLHKAFDDLRGDRPSSWAETG